MATAPSSSEDFSTRTSAASRRRRFARGLGARLASFGFYSVWRTLTFLLVLVSFFSLFVTGELDTPVSFAFLAAWTIGLVLRKTPTWWPSWLGSFLTLVVIAFLGYLARTAFFTSVLYLLLFLVIAKSFTLRTAQDYLQVQVLCFFMILSTAVITVAFHFVLFFFAYLFLATIGMVLFGMALQNERLQRAAQAGTKKPDLQPVAGSLPGRFLVRGWALPVLMLMLIVFFFLFIPHVSVRQLNAPLNTRTMPQEQLTGFSEEVTLGAFKRLQPDPTVVMRVELSWPTGAKETQRPSHLRIRGVALDYYDTRRWRRASRLDRNYEIVHNHLLNPSIRSAQSGRVTYQKFYQNADITSRLFASSIPIDIDLGRPMRIRFDREGGAAQISSFGGSRDNSFTNPLTYRVTASLVDEATPLLNQYVEFKKQERARLAETLIRARDPVVERRLTRRRGHINYPENLPWRVTYDPGTMQPEDRLAYTQLPNSPLVDRIRELAAEEMTGPTAPEMMLQATKYLRQNYGYTLEQDMRPDEDPIEHFLFDSKEGHCEYFATALVLMLRSRGIPARLVNGFYTTDWNELAQLFIVKQSDAHTWVEAWSDDLGWLTIDPTPAGSAGRGAYGEQPLSYVAAFSEFLRIQWQRYVIDYTQPRQTALFSRLRVGAGGAIDRLSSVTERLSRKKTASKSLSGDDGQLNPGRLVFQIAGAAAALFLLWRIAIIVRRRIIRDRVGSPVDYLNALLYKLESLGWIRLPGQTPLEFIASLRAAGVNAPDLDWVVGLYYRERFAGEQPKSDERRRAHLIVEKMELPAFSPRELAVESGD